MARFQRAESFLPAEPGYALLPFRFMNWSPREVLLVNEVGQYAFVPRADLPSLIAGSMDRANPCFDDLEAKHFLVQGDPELAVRLLASKRRTKAAHLEGFTKLHLFVVTLRCEHSCRYCQVSRVTANRSAFDMSEETAESAVDLALTSPAKRLKIEFQGGEPLLNFERIEHIVRRVLDHPKARGKDIQFVIATNLVPITDEMLGFIAAHGICLSTSIDGPPELHDANRPRSGVASYELVLDKLERSRARIGRERISAVMTTTERSLAVPDQIVDEYVRLGFSSIFLRPISPYGFAVRTGEAARYEMEQFLVFYRRALERVIQHNREGRPLVETYAQILLEKMLTPFAGSYVDLQSPSGAAIGAVAYNYDGRVFASDEARMLAAMGDDAFCMGTVEQSYAELFSSELVQALVGGSILESLPGCSDCAFLPYCGADPVFHYRTQGDVIGHKALSGFCQRNMSIIRHLFELLRSDDEFVRRLLLSWATGTSGPTN